MCGTSNYRSTSGADTINAVAMPDSYSCQVTSHISSLTGWATHYEICCDNRVVYGRSDGGGDRNAQQGDMVQLTCSD